MVVVEEKGCFFDALLALHKHNSSLPSHNFFQSGIGEKRGLGRSAEAHLVVGEGGGGGGGGGGEW